MASKPHKCGRQFRLQVSADRDVCVKCAIDLLTRRNTPQDKKDAVLSFLTELVQESRDPFVVALSNGLLPQLLREYCTSSSAGSSAQSFVQLFLELNRSPLLKQDLLLRALGPRLISLLESDRWNQTRKRELHWAMESCPGSQRSAVPCLASKN